MASVSVLPPHLSRWGLLGATTGLDDVYGWKVVSLESVSTEILIRGFVAQVSAKLVYCNTSGGPLQVKAVFPVDEGAAVYHCQAHLDGRTIITHCMEKSKAEKVYKEAVSAGKTAVMAQEHDDTSDILKLNLGNLPAGSKAELNLRLVMELKVQTDGAISFVLPTVLNPRYCPADHPNREAPMNRWSYMAYYEDRVVHVPQPYSISVKAQVTGSHQIARIISHTDSLSVTLADDTLSAQVGQDGVFKCDHDWSILVYYSNPYQPHLLRETGDRAATGIMKDDLLMLNIFPEVPADTYSNRNEIIIVIDRSGSMQGEKIQSARRTLLLFLKSLPAGCLFNVVSFGNTFSLLFPEGSRIYTEETLFLACRLHDSMGADMGGTEIFYPLQNIYSRAPIPGYSRQILLITDGEVWNVDQVLQLVARHAHETRLFSVGVGHGASTALVRGAARAGRGRSEMVVQQSLLQQKVMGLLCSVVQENVQDVTIVCEVEPASRVTLVPKVPPVIFGGQHLILYARVPSTTKVKSVTVRGQLGSKPVVNTLEGQRFTLVHDEAKSLHRLAARAQIQQWQLDEEEDVAEDMVALSVVSGVVCRRTALVGVDQESGNPIPEFESMQLHGPRHFLPGRASHQVKYKPCSASPHSGSLFSAGAAPLRTPVMQSAFVGAAGTPASASGSAVLAQGFSFGSGLLLSSNSAAPAQSFGSAATTFGSAATTQGFRFGSGIPYSFNTALTQISGSAAPTFGSTAPTLQNAAPVTDNLAPTFGSATPTLCSRASTFGNAPLTLFSEPPPATVSAAPTFLSAPPVCGGGNAPDCAAHTFGSAAPTFNSAVPAFGMTQGGSLGTSDKFQHILFGTQEAGPDGQSPSGLMEVVGLQQFDGSWKLNDVAQLTGVALDDLCANIPVKNEAAWATALALVLLERKFDDLRDQWKLLATKAQAFIAGCGEQVEALLAKARITLDSK